MEQKRIQYIDVAKFLAMILVVFTHGSKEGAFVAFVFSFHLPVFFFLNGMTLKIHDEPFGIFLAKKLKRYIIPMLGLGLIAVLSEQLVNIFLNKPVVDHFIFIGFAKIINQVRTFAIWFLPALFFTDLMMFGLHRLFRGNTLLMGISSLLILIFGIFYNKFYNVPLAWNFDAALFGLIFTYSGFLFRSRKLEKFYSITTRYRLLSLAIGALLLTATYFISQYNYTTNHVHLEMFSRIYKEPYITLPCALLGSLGFVYFCRAITNFIFAKPVEINLILLPLHQVLAFPLFRFVIAKEWWTKVAHLPVTDLKFIWFTVVMTAFAIACAAILHFILKYSPFSLIVNQPLPEFYKRLSFRRK